MRLKLHYKGRSKFFHIDPVKESFHEIVSRMNETMGTNNLTPFDRDRTKYESVNDFLQNDNIYLRPDDQQIFKFEDGETTNDCNRAYNCYCNGRNVYVSNIMKAKRLANSYYIVIDKIDNKVVIFSKDLAEAKQFLKDVSSDKYVNYELIWHSPAFYEMQ